MDEPINTELGRLRHHKIEINSVIEKSYKGKSKQVGLELLMILIV